MPKLPTNVPVKTTEINITQKDEEFLLFKVDGVLVAEVFGGKAMVDRDWEGELVYARRLRALPGILRAFTERLGKVHNREDHNFPKPQDKVC